MLKVLQKKVLSAVLWGLRLHFLYRMHRDWAFRQHMGVLMQRHRDEILGDLGHIMSPSVCIVAERGCNFQLFDGLLPDHRVGLIVPRGGRLFLESKLTRSHMTGKALPKYYRYFILSPYVSVAPFRDRDHFVTDYKAVDRVSGGIKRTFFDIVRFLYQSGCCLYEEDGLQFRRVENRSFTHIKVRFELLGSYEQTIYKHRCKIMEDVESLGRELGKIQQGRCLSSFMTEVTQRLLGLLTSLGVFKGEVDLEAFPDLIPVLFPFRMTDSRRNASDSSRLITIGFDLRNASKSHLGFLFDSEQVSSIVRTGGVYICTVVA